MNPQKITDLANLLRRDGDKILNSGYKFTLTRSVLRALNDCFTLIVDPADLFNQTEKFQVTKRKNEQSPVFLDLQLIYDFVQKTPLLCITALAGELSHTSKISIDSFRALKRLEIQKSDVRQIHGIQPLRSQLKELICIKSINNVEDIIIRCGADNTAGFIWSELIIADFSYNNLRKIDTSLEYAQFLQILKLQHNKLESLSAIKSLPYLKSVDLSFNYMKCVPEFHVDAKKRLQSLNICNNMVSDLTNLIKLDALIDLNLSNNYIMHCDDLLPLSLLPNLKFLYFLGNPFQCQHKYRLSIAQYLHGNTATVNFVLDDTQLSKAEKKLIGTKQLRQIGMLDSYAATMAVSIEYSGSKSSKDCTPTESVVSITSFHDLYASKSNNGNTPPVQPQTRTIEFSSSNGTGSEALIMEIDQESRLSKILPALGDIEAEEKELLEEKRKIKLLREEHGSNWLSGANAELINHALGIQITEPTLEERMASRKLFNEFLGINMDSANADDNEITLSSTPINVNYKSNCFYEAVTPIKKDSEISQENATDANDNNHVDAEIEKKNVQSHNDEYDKIYENNTNAEEIEHKTSDTEPDEDIYIVYRDLEKNSEPMFLTISSNFIREKESATNSTKAKWSIQILESCERIKSNTLRINFDTLKRDKQQRTYTVEDNLCQELEKKLRAILSQRELTDMNIITYRCVNCSNQFAHEHKQRFYHTDVYCPNCKSIFVAEIQDVKLSVGKKVPPAVAVVEEATEVTFEDAQSIKNAAKAISSSLNEAKSNSSKGSSDSKQSEGNIVKKDKLRANYESDIDIISNRSQSSVEVLERTINSTRVSSEDSDLLSNISNELLRNLESNIKSSIPRNSIESNSFSSVTDDASTQDTAIDVFSVKLGTSVSSKAEQSGFSSMFGALFQSTNLLMSGSKKLIDGEGTANIQTGIALPTPACQPYKFNYKDPSDIDHRIKLQFYQNIFDDDEHFKWLMRGHVYNSAVGASFNGLLILSTKKIYILDAFAAESENVSKWLRVTFNLNNDQLMEINLLPWKLGVACNIKEYGDFLLLLQDANYVDHLIPFFSKESALPKNCKFKTEIRNELAAQRLSSLIGNEDLKLCALLNSVDITKHADDTKSVVGPLLIATDAELWLSNNNFDWITNQNSGSEITICAKQPISNLVDVERLSDNEYSVHFLNEAKSETEVWKLKFQDHALAESQLATIGQSWEKLFGIPLL